MYVCEWDSPHHATAWFVTARLTQTSSKPPYSGWLACMHQLPYAVDCMKRKVFHHLVNNAEFDKLALQKKCFALFLRYHRYSDASLIIFLQYLVYYILLLYFTGQHVQYSISYVCCVK